MNVVHFVVGLPDVGMSFLRHKHALNDCFIYSKAQYINGIKAAMDDTKTYDEVEKALGSGVDLTLSSLLKCSMQNNSTIIWEEYNHTAAGRAYIIAKAKQANYVTHCHSIIIETKLYDWQSMINMSPRSQQFKDTYISSYVKPHIQEGFDFLTEYDVKGNVL